MSRVAAFISIPNPFDLLGKQLSSLLDLGVDAAEGFAESIVGKILGDLNGAVVGALVDMVASILEFFWEASEPELTNSWFSGSPDTPYGQMVLLAMPLLVAFLFAGIIQGVLKGDTAGMLRMVLLRLPGSVLAMSISVVLADLLIKITDDMSRAVLGNFRDDIVQVGTVLRTLRLSGAFMLPAELLTLIFGFVGLLAAVVLVVQLFVRGALIYLIAAFSPLIFAAAVWEPLRGAVRKLCEIAFALIVSKLAIAIALAVSAAAMVGSWPGGEASEIPTPELTAEQAEQSYTESVGILLSSVVMFTTGAFMPWVVWRLLPIAEGALVSQGVQGGPMRAFHSMSATVNSLRYNPATSAVRSAAQAAQRRKQGGKDTEGSDRTKKKAPATKKEPGRPIANFDDASPPRPGTKRKPPRNRPPASKSQPGGTQKAGPSKPTPGTGTPGASKRRPGSGPATGSQPGGGKPPGSGSQPSTRKPPPWPKG